MNIELQVERLCSKEEAFIIAIKLTENREPKTGLICVPQFHLEGEQIQSKILLHIDFIQHAVNKKNTVK